MKVKPKFQIYKFELRIISPSSTAQAISPIGTAYEDHNKAQNAIPELLEKHKGDSFTILEIYDYTSVL